MRYFVFLMVPTILASVLYSVGTTSAQEATPADPDAIEFLHALQNRGYYDLSTDYLNQMKERNALPEELSQLWDLEMSRNLMELSSKAYNEEESAKLLEQAKEHLSEFLKNNPDHPDAYRSLTIWGDFSRGEAQKSLAELENPELPEAQRTTQLENAKSQLEEAKTRYIEAQKQLASKLKSLPPAPSQTGKQPSKAYREWTAQKQALVDASAQADFQIALLNYLTAQTLDPKYSGEKTDTQAETRRTLYEKAAKEFDRIYQNFRMTSGIEISLIALVSHRWEAKCRLEMGEYETANDILEEVQINYNEQLSERLMPLFADAQYDLFQIMQRTEGDKWLAFASSWLNQYEEELGRTEGYQSIAWMVAQARWNLLKNASGNSVAIPVVEQGKNDLFETVTTQNVPKSRLEKDLDQLLKSMLKIPSTYQKRVLALRAELGATGGSDSGDGESNVLSLDKAKTFGEAASLGNHHAERKEWTQAKEAFAKAVSIGTTDKAQLDEAKDLVLRMEIMEANDLLVKKEYSKCLTAMERAWKANPTLPSTGLAASLALKAAFGLQGEARDAETRTKAKTKLESVAKSIMDTWPEKPVADDARLILGRSSLAEAFVDPAAPDDGKFDEAIRLFGQVNELSERYAASLSTAALACWQRYLMGKNAESPEADQQSRRNSALDYARRAKDAAIRLNESLPADQRSVMPAAQFEAQFLLGEIAMEGGDASAALEQLRPLVNAISTDPEGTRNQYTNPTLLTATRAFLAMEDVDGAASAAMVLIDSGADTLAMNRTLVNFSRQLDIQRKQANADRIVASSDTERDAAQKKLQRATDMMVKILPQLTSRRQLTIADSLNLADLCTTAGLTSEAKSIYERLIADSQTDPRAVIRARAQLAGLLRIEKKFNEAFQQVNVLLKENANAFEPRVEKARILQDWAAAESNSKLFDDAATEWIRLRNQLQNVRGQKPPEFFEVNYNAAVCLYQQAIRTAATTPDDAREKMTSARQLLQGTLVMNKSLDGPDRVAQYQQQIRKIDDFLKANKAKKK